MSWGFICELPSDSIYIEDIDLVFIHWGIFFSQCSLTNYLFVVTLVYTHFGLTFVAWITVFEGILVFICFAWGQKSTHQIKHTLKTRRVGEYRAAEIKPNTSSCRENSKNRFLMPAHIVEVI